MRIILFEKMSVSRDEAKMRIIIPFINYNKWARTLVKGKYITRARVFTIHQAMIPKEDEKKIDDEEKSPNRFASVGGKSSKALMVLRCICDLFYPFDVSTWQSALAMEKC